jgi:hypothetical protein
MRIERGHHAGDRAFDQLGIVGLLDIARLHPLEHFAEQIEPGIGIIRARCRPCRPYSTVRAGDQKG